MRGSPRSLEVENILLRDYESHYGLPEGGLTRGRIAHARSDTSRAVWTHDGGVVACEDADLAQRLILAVGRPDARDSVALLLRLQEMCGDGSYLDVSLYCAWPPAMYGREHVEMLPVQAIWPEGNELAEHVFAVRMSAVCARRPSSAPVVEGSALARSGCASLAHNRPNPKSGGYRSHAVGAATHPDYRRQGLGKAVVSALVAHIVAEGGVALWNCDVLNVPSVRLARAVGFTDFLWNFRWGVSEDEMQYRRDVINRTG